MAAEMESHRDSALLIFLPEKETIGSVEMKKASYRFFTGSWPILAVLPA
jgi:hypothetical protein